MAGYYAYRAIGDFVRNNEKIIKKAFKLGRKKLPSYSTLRRVILELKWINLLAIFNQWGIELKNDNILQEWLAIDGKSLKSTVINYNKSNQNFIVFTSLFSQESALVLQIKPFENKKVSEIKKYQEIVSNSSFRNKVFTGDALHSQKETTNIICQNNNDYLITVKKNQKKLYNKIEKVSKNEKPVSKFCERDKSHGRDINREILVFNNSEDKNTKWKKIKSLIKVKRWGIRGKEEYEKISYYISSLTATAEQFASKIRGHWHIENKLHWVKDVIFGEDNSPINDFQGAINFSVLNTIALNLFRILGFLSITKGQRWLGTRVERLSVWLE